MSKKVIHKIRGFAGEIKAKCGRYIYNNHSPYPNKVIFITTHWQEVTCLKCKAKRKK